VIAANQTIDHLDIRLFRGAVITGHITDDFGDAAPNARVTLMRAQYRRGDRTLTAATGVTTNDIGEYRMFGLSPGEYYISAMGPPQGTAAPAARDSLEGQEARNGYAPTFYPGTPTASLAQKLTVGLAQTLNEISFALVAARTATIHGRAVDSLGRPIPGVVQIRPRDGTAGLSTAGGPIRADGTFAIPNVYPGAYVLVVNGPRGPNQPPRTSNDPEFALAYVIVNGEDVTDVALTPVVPVSITGRISFEDQDAARSVASSAVRVATLAATVGDAGLGVGSGGNPLPVNDDFTFAMRTTPGRMAIRATAAGWLVKAIRISGRDITDNEIDVSGQGLNDVEIEMTNRLQEISGSVTDTSGKAAANAMVLIFAQDRSHWTAPFGRYEARSRTDADGRFATSSLPPGEYLAIAVDDTNAIEGQDPAFLESLSGHASAFSLAPADHRTLNLNVYTAP
jgi:protocatechuate 3,4-dioxygenase beta subunit